MKTTLPLSRKRRLEIVMAVCFALCIGEVLVGRLTSTLVIIADAFHMIADLVGYSILYASISLSQRDDAPSPTILPLAAKAPSAPPRSRHFAALTARLPYGWKRAGILGAFFNGSFLLAVGLSIVLQATERFVDRRAIEHSQIVIGMGVAALVCNGVMALVFHEGHGHSHSHSHGAPFLESPRSSTEQLALGNEEKSSSALLHQRSLAASGVIIHILGDALNTIGVIIVGIISLCLHGSPATSYIDAALSLAIGFSIMTTAAPLTYRSGLVLLQSTPTSFSIERIAAELKRLPGVARIDELRIWQLNEEHSVASVKIILVLPESKSGSHVYHCMVMPGDVLRRARAVLRSWGIEGTTVEVEFDAWQLPASPVTSSPPRAASDESARSWRRGGEDVVVAAGTERRLSWRGGVHLPASP